MAATVPARAQVLSVYRQFIKNANQFTNYNFREYFLRRTRNTFKQNKTVEDPARLAALFGEARAELKVLKRQSVISQMYTFDKTVVEPLNKRSHG
ncbi:Isd11p KNAG_0L01340 [Huiozyma naganishii CBS 8797]|uniref:Complex 1 LYR protein domain-containing protein n=1 Tax=Huiozyma naganishii (strain ATCC MYA-139 / BCRC 22969 / CBS 8797 / KCTC 17520 / NBRC 10181 / NCYC 3082 / Yp74L-3) TaxID=1071383 RepID=J7SAH5_HUIN7|nr:hypothetical protein KNAG_0L01340 [Kazachstania naganishii CBS 8797]CCK72754.1 hypothetical protein KNAG_0L01340 [Kazachstania naganishii CBS 8797]